MLRQKRQNIIMLKYKYIIPVVMFLNKCYNRYSESRKMHLSDFKAVNK